MSNETTKLTRQEIYQKIRETSKDEYIIHEMKRLGFWEKDTEKPSPSEAYLSKKIQLQKELRELNKQQNLFKTPEEAIKHLHKERKKAALEKREQTKLKRNQTRYNKAKSWHNIQKKLITYIGDRFSFGLKDVNSDFAKLDNQNLLKIHDSKALADAMGISINELRFLAFQKDVSHINHYQRFEMPKKTGGVRLISAPMPRLKRAQYWILENLLNQFKLHEAANGFVTQKSILTNAVSHIKKDIVINLDLKDFFPTVNYPRVKGVFRNAGYSEHLSTILGLICTEPDTQEVELDGKDWFVSNGQRYLPQGAPTSPMLSNIICRKLDARLQGMADKLGFAYSRYADDLSFSGNNIDNKQVTQLLWRTRQIVKDEGFFVHPDKTKIMRKHKKQEVTGIVVNEKPSVDRKTLRKFRALLHQIDLTGPINKEWGKGELFASIEGYANFVAMVDPIKGLNFQKKIILLKEKYKIQSKHGKVRALNKKIMKAKSALGQKPRDNWWEAKAPAEPVLEKTHAQIQQEKAQIKQAKVAEQTRPNESTSRASQAPDTRSEYVTTQANTSQSTQSAFNDNENNDVSVFGKVMQILAILFFIILVINIIK